MTDTFFSNLPDKFYKQLLNSLDEGIYFVDKSRRIVFWNQGAARISGFTSEDVIGKLCGDKLLEHVDFDGNHLCGDGCPLTATIQDGEIHQLDVFLKHRDGHRIPVQVSSSPVLNENGEIVGVVERFRDITPQLSDKNRMAKLLSEVHTDPLTEIANRRYLELALHDRFYRFEEYQEKFGVMFVDMDKLKKINDQFGHAVGDCALKFIAETLKSTFRRDDVVGRWGGDEFLVILNDVDKDQLKKIKKKIEKIIAGTQLPEACGGGMVSISVGLAAVLEGDTQNQLLNRSDANMYGEKKEQPGRD
ncbi:MAG: diguanylate cyclase [Chloroflexota bacterium]